MVITTTIVGALALAVAIGAFLSIASRAKVDAREPPAIYSPIPFFGHIIGMLREGPLYIARISAQSSAPIFAMPMLGGKSYVCKNPQYAALIQRATSTLDFDGIVVNMTPRMVGSHAKTSRILVESQELMKRSHGIINPPLSQQHMGSIAAIQLAHFGDFINKIQNGHEVDLFRFITREVTAATMRSFYGPRNPFAVDPSLIEAFWDWEWEIVAYMVGVMRSVFARKAQAGLERCVKGFEKYAAEDGYKDASGLVQNRKALHEDFGISPHEHARLELGLCFGFNSNASITTFWVLNNIFSRPPLLAEVRAEIERNAIVSPGTIAFTKLRDNCPLLNSIYKETMRLAAPMTSARMVHEDTLIADTFLLRKGAVVQIAGGILHQDATIWGPDVSSFNARRFEHNWTGSKTDKDGNVSNAKGDQVHASAFRGFGGGASLCPGRFIAQMEIISLAAAVVCAFDLEAPQGKTTVEWDPPRDDKRFPFSVVKPLRELNVQLKRREGLEDVHWTLQA
ncbi:cytochrome P450 [Karstenula rhodostoma CBS 690.94]|uniref:Cytochrome P450 n=1 Tax=Karstenula rhodostoma CBS 690.94 TaxID=1392251 RepID=A0A9P4PRL4_9PLEO|nr:cytochrome P450 [Karstenula rhodostoma CBS 690.94]